MFRKLQQLLIVLLVLPSLTLNEARASARPSVGPSPCKASFYPLAREDRRKIQQRIEASSQIAGSLPKYQFNPSLNVLLRESSPRGRWLFGGNPTNLLMSLQP
jgi:hypothetical protein